MKNLLKISLLLMTLAIFSCDDGGESGSSDLTSGPWNLVALDISGTSSNTISGFTITQDITSVGRDFNATATFNDDGTYTSSGSYVIDQTATSNGQSLTTEIPISDVLGSGTYTLDSVENPTVISITTMGETNAYPISRLTNDEFNISVNIVISEQTAGGFLESNLTTSYMMTR